MACSKHNSCFLQKQGISDTFRALRTATKIIVSNHHWLADTKMGTPIQSKMSRNHDKIVVSIGHEIMIRFWLWFWRWIRLQIIWSRQSQVTSVTTADEDVQVIVHDVALLVGVSKNGVELASSPSNTVVWVPPQCFDPINLNALTKCSAGLGLCDL